ncbi:hypothetical protein BD410DRAFT_725893 [Rickenella mellea]|uniref:RING-type domain-containing protein n=1 Tax=Rickenella mellea TaxID=50990 RepID=A0A4Y7PZ65_9AGAM|nr:hypothetical protein BD410DRAFT_725893 [Rickenella mellea]
MSNGQDLIIVLDATYSMGNFLDALRQSIPEIVALSKLSGAFERIAVLPYKDYCDKVVTDWSGFNTDLESFAAKLEPFGGGDYPEAAKSALIRTFDYIDKKKQTLILWFADAPPHSIDSDSGNAALERKSFPAGSTDWVKLCYAAKENNCTVFSFLSNLYQPDAYSQYYVFLSQVTGGVCMLSSVLQSQAISRLTVDVLLQRLGLLDSFDTIKHNGVVTRRFSVSPLASNSKPSSEVNHGNGWLKGSKTGITSDSSVIVEPFELSSSIHAESSASSSHFHNLGKRFADKTEGMYRSTVYTTLTSLINSNVYALTYNPVFGQLWRAVCKESDNMEKQALVDAFSVRVSQLKDGKEKADMQQWLEDSFDSTEEINEIIATVDASAPRVYLDLDSEVELTRKELLEVSKSCYAGVLRKLVQIFTHLKIVEENVVLAPNQRSIPLSLNPRDFFRILPHLVVPGTLYPPRAASLTATLALTTDVSFLKDSATALLAPLKGKWINLDVPENISYDCARFLLSAPRGVVLSDDERVVYEAMRRYKLIELNLDSTLQVKLPWTPTKSRGVGDSKVKCQKCLFRRSVTIMSHELPGLCGLCVAFERESPNDIHKYGETNDVSVLACVVDDSCWVECSVTTCRAQYVVEDPGKLNVRPKCHYCRINTPCPWLECSRCKNRIVYPEIYRDNGQKPYLCPGCFNPKCSQTTIAISETTTRVLVKENGNAWLELSPSIDLLQSKSAFKMMQAHGLNVFDPVPLHGKLQLVSGGKPVFSSEDVRTQVESRVGKGEIELGCCPLCMDEWPRNKLLPACGRTKCAHRLDEACLAQWYGCNEPGKLLNLMQFSCPFCRRIPVTKVLTRYNPQAAVLGGLKDAMDDRAWFYAWCVQCGFAKRAVERQCCDGERLPPLHEYRCEDCTGKDGQADVRLVSCPKCGVMVEKLSGCNHISCQCGEHFCFVCGGAFPDDEIYDHMVDEHGGIYDDEDDDNEDE